MHTSSGVDNVDEFAETIVRRTARPRYRYGNGAAAGDASRRSACPTAPPTARWRQRNFTTYRTHHGPIVREAERQVDRLRADEQAGRGAGAVATCEPRRRDYAGFLKVAALQGQLARTTRMFADDKGEIAYLHPQFVPRRDDRFDYRKPVDGSDPATDWGGTSFARPTSQRHRPANGWVAQHNNWPWRTAGAFSPNPTHSPNTWTCTARIIAASTPWGLADWEAAAGPSKDLNAAAFRHRPAGRSPTLLAGLLSEAYDALPKGGPDARSGLAAPVRAAARSGITAGAGSWSPRLFANFWADKMWRAIQPVARNRVLTPYLAIAATRVP